ncbi:MAG: YigZ family protein [Bifidobacteriaceae bacterium]|jgi:uncharacterized YigZ family protein|nr:YigZ family protein [Bifidobacteriaceae bacterium]
MGLRHLAEPLTYEQVIKKSRFIARLFPVTAADQAKELVETVRKSDYGARHHATAMVLGPEAGLQRSNDDGEPSGTAGLPMLQALHQAAVTDLLAVVTRYFGGVKLGRPGLIRAYGGTVSSALNQASFYFETTLEGFELEVAAAEGGRLEHILRQLVAGQPGAKLEPSYGQTVRFQVWLPEPAGRALNDLLAGPWPGVRLRPIGQRRLHLPQA